ncbi:MAG: LysM peptidoglycan-binding domain-containing protein [Chloroflexota bacterium]
MRLFIFLAFFTLILSNPSPASASASVNNGVRIGNIGDTCASITTLSQIPTGAARVNAGGVTIVSGFLQVTTINQNPVMIAFNAGGNKIWCKDNYETVGVDGRGVGLYWDGTVLYGLFTVDGGDNSYGNADSFNANGWQPSYGSGGGSSVTIVARIDPNSGASQGATFIISQLTNNNTNTVVPTAISYTGSSVIVGSMAFFSPLNIDKSRMGCTGPSPFAYTIEFSADLSTAIGAAAVGCDSTSPPPSQIIATDGTAIAGGLLLDGRINPAALAGPVAIYCTAEGIMVWDIDPVTSRGDLVIVASPAAVREALASAQRSERNTEIAAGGTQGSALYALTSGELQVNSFEQNGTLYEFIFPGDRCDDVFADDATSAATPETQAALFSDASAAAPPGTQAVHVVQAGENLFRIGLRYSVPYPVIGTFNQIPPPYRVDIGQVIYIPDV